MATNTNRQMIYSDQALDRIESYLSGKDEPVVVTQSPIAGSRAFRGDTVTVTVAVPSDIPVREVATSAIPAAMKNATMADLAKFANANPEAMKLLEDPAIGTDLEKRKKVAAALGKTLGSKIPDTQVDGVVAVLRELL